MSVRITFELNDHQADQLQEVAQSLGIATEDLAKATVADWLAKPRDDFEKAAKYLLEKNEELYRRLS